MELHTSTYDNKQAFLFLDQRERVVEYFTNFMRSQVRSPRVYASGTLDRYAEKLRDFGTYLECHDIHGRVRVDDTLQSLNRLIVADFLTSLQDGGLSDSTVRLAEAAVRRFTSWMATDEAKYAHSRAVFPQGAKLLTPSPSNRQPRFLTYQQIIELVKGMHFEAQRLVVHFMYDTGLRVSEVPRVLLRDLPQTQHYPSNQMYFPLIVKGSKGRNRAFKERTTIISRPMLTRLAKHHNTRQFRFNLDLPEAQRPCMLNVFGDPWTPDAIEKLIEKAKERSGLQVASPHSCRHGLAYSILRSEHGKSFLDNLVILQRVLGHTSITTTEIYTHIPAPLLQRLSSDYGQADFKFRYEEAQAILDATYLAAKNQPPIRRIGKGSI